MYGHCPAYQELYQLVLSLGLTTGNRLTLLNLTLNKHLNLTNNHLMQVVSRFLLCRHKHKTTETSNKACIQCISWREKDVYANISIYTKICYFWSSLRLFFQNKKRIRFRATNIFATHITICSSFFLLFKYFENLIGPNKELKHRIK